MNAQIEHIPCDMTVTADAGVTVSALQSELAKGGQWLAIDPPAPHKLTIADLLAKNLSGPRRFGYGTIRDYTIGLKVRLADGRVIKSGGKVVKNVAGYDLQKLFIGAEHSLGMIVEATFKVRPLPEVEKFVRKSCAKLAEAESAVAAVLESPITPAVLDFHNLGGQFFTVVLGFDGACDEVEWQLARAQELGFVENADLEHEKTFWKTDAATIRKISVLPSRLFDVIAQGGIGDFVARAGNGIIFDHGPVLPFEGTLPVQLMKRTRQAFDPNNVFAPLPS